MKAIQKTTAKSVTLMFLLFLMSLTPLKTQAQVTVGSLLDPARAALLELKTQQDASLTVANGVVHDKNITSTTGGFLLPRVKLVDPATMEPFILTTDPEWTSATSTIKLKLAGLMVYNLSTTPSGLIPGICVWDGSKWNTATPSLAISAQPKKFTFYENFVLKPEVIARLTVTASGGVAPLNYQWYQVTGSNIHVRVGTSLGTAGGANTEAYDPT